MNPDINIESYNIKKGDLIKWRCWSTYGIVIDALNHTVKIFWLSESEPDQVTWEQRMNIEVISAS